ncbi:3-hydroxyacyl-CoA dehydrogenase [Sphingobacterium psychroaquaticum]|uniref:3-hydroxybutyryl-CoA dehydrogenase n=1 Tax=Sphingobacterium psychroaquaticum TaxID=561061 RepID=A0A1X7JKR8_9SPHI|nr:3-hydroxyacyl-CoA dehydrogenase [Sphingobacterium psychroaquaticum]SMG28780.1 3-hydroxybutyryl-CoA dehydrogenase [Sphingobacterium psychroaquaticum]
MEIKNVTVAGSGVLGYQIAFQTAFHGFNVTVYDINDKVLEKAKAKFDNLAQAYKKDLQATDTALAAAKSNLQYTSDLAVALKEADLLIEAVPENPQIKIDFYKKARAVAPEKTRFATNSSTLLPSQFAAETGRPEKFLALHFANEIWKHNTAEIMGHPGTDKQVFDQVVEFAKNIGMIALPLHKEQPGYIVNSLLVPLLGAATDLLVNNVADVQTIDKTWMVATGAPVGPFAILDVVGITTAYNINKMEADATGDPLKVKTVAFLKENFIDKNKLGVATGEGFYKYPNPAFTDPDFLT